MVGVCGAIAVLIVWVSVLVRENYARNSAFQLVMPSMQVDEVRHLLGEPNQIRRGCRDAPTWLGEPVDSDCDTEFQYETHFMPAFWTIGFNKKGEAISKYYYSSP